VKDKILSRGYSLQTKTFTRNGMKYMGWYECLMQDDKKITPLHKIRKELQRRKKDFINRFNAEHKWCFPNKIKLSEVAIIRREY